MLSYKTHKQYNSGLILRSGFIVFINYLLIQIIQYFLNDKYPKTPIISYSYLLILLMIFLIMHVVKDHKKPYDDLEQLYDSIETDYIKSINKSNNTIIYQKSDLSNEDIQEYIDFENNLVKDQIQEVQNRLTKNVSQLFDTINTNKLIIDNKNIELSKKINEYNQQSNSLDTIHEIKLNEHQEKLDELDQSVEMNKNLIENNSILSSDNHSNILEHKTILEENNRLLSDHDVIIQQNTNICAINMDQGISNKKLIQENESICVNNFNDLNKLIDDTNTVVNQQIQENKTIIYQKDQENKAIIDQKTQDNTSLIDQKTQENRDFIDQKTQENKELINQKHQENKESIDYNNQKINKNESDIGQLFMKVGTNISNISSNSSNITDNSNNIQNLDNNQKDIKSFINKYTGINNINKILPDKQLYFLNRDIKTYNSMEYELNLDNLQEWNKYKYSDFIHEINAFLNIATFDSEMKETYTTLDRIEVNLVDASRYIIKSMLINQFRSDNNLNTNSQYILDDKVYMDIKQKYEAIEDLLVKIYPNNIEYSKGYRNSRRNDALHRILFKSGTLLSTNCFAGSVPLSQRKQIYLLNILYGKNIYSSDEKHDLDSICKQIINQHDKDYASLLSDHKSKMNNHIQYHISKIKNLSLNLTKYISSDGSQLKAINKHIKELLKTVDAIYSIASLEKKFYHDYIFPAINSTINEYQSLIHGYNKLLTDQEKNQNQIGYNIEEYNNKIKLFEEAKDLYEDLMYYICYDFLKYGNAYNTVGLESMAYSPWKKVVGYSGDFNISSGLIGSYPRSSLCTAYSKIIPILENIEQLHVISKRIDMILLAMSN